MEKRFPQYLSSPYQVLWFEADDLAIVFICFLLAMIFGYIFWIALFLVPYLYMKAKKKYPRGFLKHVLCFAGVVSFKGYPGFFEKNFNE